MGWRGKLICLLIFYFAGFATAIYCLAPVSKEQNAVYAYKGFPYTATKSDQFAKSFDVVLHKGIHYTQDAASRAADYLKQKSNEKEADHPTVRSAAINR